MPVRLFVYCQLIIMEDDEKWEQPQKKQKNVTRQRSANLKRVKEEPFNPQDPLQQFYRQSKPLEAEGSSLSRMGWKVANLSRQQQDMALSLMGLLSNELIFPVTVITHILERSQSRQEQTRSLWIQVNFITTEVSKDTFNLDQQNNESRIITFYLDQLLPSLKTFINMRLDWKQIVNGQCDSSILAELFRKEVIEACNSRIEGGGLLSKEKE